MDTVVLHEMQKRMSIPEHALILDVRTRWNSLFLMIQRFGEQYPAVAASAWDERLRKRMEHEKIGRINDEDLRNCEDFCGDMEILYTCTLAICTVDTPTLGQVFPTQTKIEQTFKEKEGDSPFVKVIKKTMWADLSKRYQDENQRKLLEEATAIDPRFKAYMADNEEVWSRLSTHCVEEFKKFDCAQVKVKPEPADEDEAVPIEVAASEATASEATESEEPVQPPPKRKPKSAIESLFADDDDLAIVRVELAPTPEIRAKNEIDQYKAMPSLRSGENPILFWQTYSAALPLLSNLACKYMCISGSSVASERIFSLAGSTICQQRASLDPGKANQLIFLAKNAQ